MKKSAVLMAISMATATMATAQVNFGLKGGLNLTEIAFSKSEMEDAISNKSGFFIGPTVKFTLPIVGVGVDVAALYDQREGEIKGTDQKLKQQTLQVPIHLRTGFGLGDFASVYVFAGPQLGFNINHDEKNLGIGEWRLRDASISANAGLGFMVANHVQLSANYNFALSKSGVLHEYKQENSEQTTKVKNNAWQIAIAYYF